MVCKPGGLSGRHDSGAGGSRTGRRTQASHPMPRVVRLKHCARQPLVSARHFPHVRLPSSPLHKQARLGGAGGDEARGGRRSVAWYLCSHGAEAACRSRAPGRIVWRAWPTPRPNLVVVWSAPTGAAFAAPQAVEPRPQQSSVRPARAPLAARAAVTVAATSAKSVGDSMSRTSRSPPTCARSTAPSPTI